MMGLSCSHNAYNGSCSSFMDWRLAIAKYAGLPPLRLMEGFYVPNEPGYPSYMAPTFADTSGYVREIASSLPISWDCLAPSPLHELLYHSDCDGSIPYSRCLNIATSLQDVLDKIPNVPNNHMLRFLTKRFINGLLMAARSKEDLLFR